MASSSKITAVVLALLISDVANASFFKLCRDEFEGMMLALGRGSPASKAAYATKVHEQRIALESVRQILKEKNLKYNVEQVAAERAKIAPLTIEYSNLRSELNSLENIPPANASAAKVRAARIAELKTAMAARSEVAAAELALSRRLNLLLEECPSGNCVTPKTRALLIQTGDILIAPDPNIPFRTPGIVSALQTGKKVPEIFVITHQVFDSTIAETVEMLRTDPHFTSVPRVVLGGDRFKVNSAELYKAASIVRKSDAGEFPSDMDIFADTYHMAGGYCGRCLKQSIKEILELSKRRAHSARIVLHGKQIYTDTGTLASEIQRAQNSLPEKRRTEFMGIVQQMVTFRPNTTRFLTGFDANPLIVETTDNWGAIVTLEFRY